MDWRGLIADCETWVIAITSVFDLVWSFCCITLYILELYSYNRTLARSALKARQSQVVLQCAIIGCIRGSVLFMLISMAVYTSTNITKRSQTGWVKYQVNRGLSLFEFFTTVRSSSIILIVRLQEDRSPVVEYLQSGGGSTGHTSKMTWHHSTYMPQARWSAGLGNDTVYNRGMGVESGHFEAKNIITVLLLLC